MRSPADIDLTLASKWLRDGIPAVAVEIIDVSGSAPRGVGTIMLVTADAITGTIGGGALEWARLAEARALLASNEQRRKVEQALGPEIGQCCGGRVRASVTRLTENALGDMRTPSYRPNVCIFGAGHVGVPLTQAVAPLPLTLEICDHRAR